MSPLSPEIAAYKAAYGLFAGNGGDTLPNVLNCDWNLGMVL